MKRERLDILAKKFASESISSGEIMNYDLFEVLEYGFKMGAKLTDAGKWNDIDKQPDNESDILIQYKFNGCHKYRSIYIDYKYTRSDYCTWEDYVRSDNILKWMYISDITDSTLDKLESLRDDDEDWTSLEDRLNATPENETKMDLHDCMTCDSFRNKTCNPYCSPMCKDLDDISKDSIIIDTHTGDRYIIDY